MELRNDVPLAPLTTLGVGGCARYFARVESEQDLLQALAWATAHRVKVRILGGGSNVVIADAGVPELVIQLALRGIELVPAGSACVLSAAAGEPWDDVVAVSVEHDLVGLECLSGIPGSVGATPVQNVGAYGQEVADTIDLVRVFDRQTETVRDLSPEECRFAYRDSYLKSGEPGRYVVLRVAYRLERGTAPKVRYPDLIRELESRGVTTPTVVHVRQAVLAVRTRKAMVASTTDPNARSCGSFFVNPIVEASHLELVQVQSGVEAVPHWPLADGRIKLAAAWLIERAGFGRGLREGRVGLSHHHALAIVAHEGAHAYEVVALARRIRIGVEERFSVRLIPEPNFWGFSSLDDGLPDERLA